MHTVNVSVMVRDTAALANGPQAALAAARRELLAYRKALRVAASEVAEWERTCAKPRRLPVIGRFVGQGRVTPPAAIHQCLAQAQEDCRIAQARVVAFEEDLAATSPASEDEILVAA